MKLPTILIILLLTGNLTVGQEWHTDLDSAKQISMETGRPIMLVFSGSDWCAPCIRFERNILDQDVFLEFARENFILLNIDFPRKKKNKPDEETVSKNRKIAETYNPEGAFPKVLLLDNEGKILMKQLEHSSSDATDYINYLSGVLKFLE